MATQYYKSGDPMYDIPLTILITIVMGLLGTLISDFTQIVGTKISTLWKYFKTKFNDIIFGNKILSLSNILLIINHLTLIINC